MINIILHTLCPLTSELWHILYTPLCGDTGSENTFKISVSSYCLHFLFSLSTTMGY